MENKEDIAFPKEIMFPDFFVWFKYSVINRLNRTWSVALPPNSGTAVFRDSKSKTILDLSKVVLDGTVTGPTGPSGPSGPPIGGG